MWPTLILVMVCDEGSVSIQNLQDMLPIIIEQTLSTKAKRVHVEGRENRWQS